MHVHVCPASMHGLLFHSGYFCSIERSKASGVSGKSKKPFKRSSKKVTRKSKTEKSSSIEEVGGVKRESPQDNKPVRKRLKVSCI